MRIRSYDHVGLRITDKSKSLDFYSQLGFVLDAANSTDTALEIVNIDGVRLNLIPNGVATPEGDNILLDRPTKWPGYTHAAFTVGRLADVTEWAERAGMTITEGPVDWGRRLTCFLRDPDSNVLEFNELIPTAHYRLVIGQKNYSSWSMRAWLLMRMLELPFEEVRIGLYTETSRTEVQSLGGETGLVPVLKVGDLAIWDTLAIAEYLHETFRQVWPQDPGNRARARSICGEVHSGLNALRDAMPVNIRARGRSAVRSPAVQADIDRVIEIWTNGMSNGADWLFGEFGIVDIMFAPVATRFETYAVDLPPAALSYQRRLLRHPLVAEWLSLAVGETEEIESLEIGRQG